MGRIWLVRHGESTWNALGLVQGQVDLPTLTALGLRQARRCARSLAREPISAVYSSDLRRAQQTAEPLARQLGIGVVVDPGLRERALGVAEGIPSARLYPRDSGIVRGKVVDADASPIGGESIRQLYRRAADSLATILAAPCGGDIALVCHGGVVRVLLAWLDGVEPDEMAWPPIDNALRIARPATMPAQIG